MAHAVGPVALGLDLAATEVEGRDADRGGRLPGREAVAAGPLEARQGVSPLAAMDEVSPRGREAVRHPGEAVG